MVSETLSNDINFDSADNRWIDNLQLCEYDWILQSTRKRYRHKGEHRRCFGHYAVGYGTGKRVFVRKRGSDHIEGSE
jgi:hypothetical protein